MNTFHFRHQVIVNVRLYNSPLLTSCALILNSAAPSAVVAPPAGRCSNRRRRCEYNLTTAASIWSQALHRRCLPASSSCRAPTNITAAPSHSPNPAVACPASSSPPNCRAPTSLTAAPPRLPNAEVIITDDLAKEICPEIVHIIEVHHSKCGRQEPWENSCNGVNS